MKITFRLPAQMVTRMNREMQLSHGTSFSSNAKSGIFVSLLNKKQIEPNATLLQFHIG